MSFFSKYIGIISAISGAVLFSLKPVLIKLIYNIEKIETIELLVLRMLISLPFYIVILFYFLSPTRVNHQIKTYWKSMISLGFIGFYLASYLDFWGLQYISAGLERAIIFLNPTIVVILGAFFLKKKISWQQTLAIVLSYCGIMLAFMTNTQLGNQENILLGALLVFGSAFFYALYLIGSEIYLNKIGTVPFTCYTMIVAFVFIFAHYIMDKPLSRLFQFDKQIYVLATIMAIVSTILPSFLFSEGIKRIGAANGSIIGGIGPISTIVLAYIILAEAIGLWQLVGTGLVILGVLIISYNAKKSKSDLPE